MKRTLPLLSLALSFSFAAPAMAGSFEGPTFNLSYGYETQTWNVPNTTGTAAFGYSTPMHTFTLTDESGSVLAVATGLSRTQASRMNAEREAIRRKESSFSYTVYSAQPHPGLKLAMTVGMGETANFTGVTGSTAGLSSKMFKLGVGSDMFELLGGTVAWDWAYAGYNLQKDASSSSTVSYSASQSPLGLSYRYGVPLPFFPVLIEPFAHVDLGYWMGSGFKSYDARDYGAKVAVELHPLWKLEGRWTVATMAQSGATDTTKSDLASLSSLTLGTTMTF